MPRSWGNVWRRWASLRRTGRRNFGEVVRTRTTTRPSVLKMQREIAMVLTPAQRLNCWLDCVCCLSAVQETSRGYVVPCVVLVQTRRRARRVQRWMCR